MDGEALCAMGIPVPDPRIITCIDKDPANDQALLIFSLTSRKAKSEETFSRVGMLSQQGGNSGSLFSG
jgi:hypothetical protein